MFNKLKNKIKKTINTDEKKRLVSNFFSLSILQGLNYLLHLLTVPYLVRVIGVEKFGLLAFATATIAYFNIIVDYGFNLTATRDISVNRDDKKKVQEIFSSVMTIKFVLMLISFLILIGLVFFFDKFRQDSIIYFLSFGTVVGQMLFPVWFFQGMEQMKYITYLNVIARIIFTVAIFVFVKSEKDFYLVPLFNSVGFIVAGILSLIVVISRFNTIFKLQEFSVAKKKWHEATHIFTANIAISLYTTSTIFILGLFTNNITVGYFSGAYKIIQVFKGLFAPMSQSIYPHIAKKIAKSRDDALVFIKKVFIYITIFTLIISLGVLLTAPFLVSIILGIKYLRSILILKIMSFLPFLIATSNILGIQTMLNLGYKKAFRNILIIGGLLNMLLSFILVPRYAGVGSALSIVLVESFITITMFIYLYKRDLKILGGCNV